MSQLETRCGPYKASLAFTPFHVLSGVLMRCTCTLSVACTMSEDSEIAQTSIPAFNSIAANSPLGAVTHKYTTNMLFEALVSVYHFCTLGAIVRMQIFSYYTHIPQYFCELRYEGILYCRVIRKLYFVNQLYGRFSEKCKCKLRNVGLYQMAQFCSNRCHIPSTAATTITTRKIMRSIFQ